ncbi:MAG: ribose 5-phosphate isomerase B [Chloroflexota bacterium]
MKIAIASDHAGFELKKQIADWLKTEGHQILDFGAFSDERTDYPDFAYPASESVAANVAHLGILICGTGIGMSIAANKVAGIRAANCFIPETAELARQHNNANVLTLGARFIDFDAAKDIIHKFLTTDFEGGRHMVRIEKIHNLTGF